jgi:cell division protein FtsB
MEAKRIIFYIIALGVILAVIFLPGYSRLVELREENEIYQKRIDLLEEHNKRLDRELTQFREDPSYVERKAREKLGVVRKGEIIYRVGDHAR